MKKYNCIIIDDDEIDRLTVVSFAKKFQELHILGVFADAEDAGPLLGKESIDILFLDIDMPSLNGLEFRKMAAHVPVCVFITAHPEHAVESFQLDTLDFIVKPVKLNRFTQTMARINDYMELKLKAQLFESSIGGDVIYIKEGHEQTKVKLHDILYLEALKDYTKIVTSAKRHCVLSNIGTLLKEENFNSFIRIHRSYAVQKQYIKKILTNEVLLNNDILIPIGRSYKENLNTLL
ncbi:DNA-binding response regulator [Flavobacterium noncentrifugens]|uniref:Two component transcriptional regulator, LytTR family n=1 Tax=Flavobacterium noncentrifugens TaxID=1128970 RepID=A0A1G9ARH3_9FLAO|nr:LytTR family DNA-binding domain-containing protein [Flavobacterium noncentrifugens]GEP51557.1 DNA-binding response regulator [Flavobacterium noncentrifugens]SDK29868.1 two component transcriptional regulator, LytTR family [Flavobacterium noncentrifugens]